ncbi:hypothetical protein EZV62_027010 [Acer yangbiense]|uniref:non-specific serine/threonine protein kinase n=1 Tax=Acer yangbiense TaxID=1000413 RepID=A0A5C7GUC5_9ROSI|nr:hypothetical protein EZV62_027010 [Acer yangbiense]
MGATNWTFGSDACEIDFAYNYLKGSIPLEWASMQLTYIDFAYNYLMGSIPLEWASMQLKYISVFANRLSGNIPSHWGKITSLTYLDLDQNQFSGMIPPELGKLVNLKILRLSSNRFSGILPLELAELKNLTNFRINDNNFTGSIPKYISSWSGLSRLEIQGSGLKGPIPPSLSVLDKLTQIRISDIHGTNQSFPVLTNMTGLTRVDLSFNKLTRELTGVPISASFKFIFLTGNSLSGIIPPSVLKKGINVYWHSFYINCGGDTVKVNGRTFEGDSGVGGGAATYHLFYGTNWGFSSTGDFTDDDDEQNTHYIATSNASNISELYIDACIDKLVEKDFDIEAKAPGVLNPLIVPYNANVTNNILEICFYWAGKGTTAIPVGVYGPLISAISVEPKFKHRYREGKKKTMSIGVAVAVVELCLIILMLGILYRRRYLRTKLWREKGLGFFPIQRSLFQTKQLDKVNEASKTIFIACEEDMEEALSVVKKGILTFSSEWLMNCIMKQELDLETPQFAESLDIKPTNVLLDRDLNPKISNFGLAKLDEEEKTHINPFVVAFHLYQNGKLMELVDQNLEFEFDKVEAERMRKVALLCANASPSLRPTMSEVVNMLEGTIPLPDAIPEAGSYSEDMKFKALRDKRLMMHNHIYHSSSTSSSSGPSSTHDDVREVNAEKYMKLKPCEIVVYSWKDKTHWLKFRHQIALH